MLATGADKTSIRTLRARGSDVEPALFQLRLASALSSVDLRPPSLPRSGIACIRRVQDPLPGRLSSVRAGEPLPRDWQAATIEAMDRLVRRAARPAHGEVPTSAEAIVFADEAELLACLARDWCDGVTTTRWWWAGLLKDADVSRAALVAWLEAPRYVPAAVLRLAPSGHAVRFVGAMQVEEARRLLRAITFEFALDHLRAALDATVDASSPPLLSAPDAAARPWSVSANPFTSQAASQPGPWTRWVPESQAAGLSAPHQALLGIAVMLYRAPSVVRTVAFAEAVREWQRVQRPATSNHPAAVFAAVGPPSEPPQAHDRRQRAPGARARSAAFGGSVGEVMPETAPRAQAAPEPPITSLRPRAARSDAEPMQTHTHSAPARLEPAAPPPARRGWLPNIGPTRHLASASGPGPARRAPRLAPWSAPPPAGGPVEPAVAPGGPSAGEARRAIPAESAATEPQLPDQSASLTADVELEVATRLGGVLFLLNLGVYLGLYGDFTTPQAPGIPLSIWDFVALLGQRLVRGHRRGEHADPVWALLAHLAGRGSHERPGRHFPTQRRQAESWRMPLEWLASFPETGAWRWSLIGGRLRVHHPAGFVVLDLPCGGGDAVSTLRSELYPFRRVIGFDLRRARLAGSAEQLAWLLTPSSAAERWMNRLAPYARARLRQALGAEPGQLLCAQPAHVRLTQTRLDAFFSLAALPIEVRLAGLDRDPGWLPAGGRFVAFHFEAPEGA